MAGFLNLLKKDQHYLVLIVLLVIFIVFDIEVPSMAADLIDTLPGKIVVAIIALSLCTTKHPIICALVLIAAYELIKRSSEGSVNLGQAVKFIPSEKKKSQALSAMNQFPITVEEQVISKMIPKEAAPIITAPSYKPMLDKLHDAAKLN